MKGTQLDLAALLTDFFTRHVAAERNLSRATVVSYRDTFRLLLRYISEQAGRPVARLTMADLSADRILAFLDHLERVRGNSVQTRNARLAALRSFFGYVVTRDISLAAHTQQVRFIPFKKGPGRLLGYLTKAELLAILAQPNRTTSRGRRDYLILALLYDTGARVNELLMVRPADFRFDKPPLLRLQGKGRKPRIVPLLPATTKLVIEYLDETNRSRTDSEPLVRNRRDEPMTRSGVACLLEKYRTRAAADLPSLRRPHISPHTMRHSKAMHLIQSDVLPVTVKDILGHAHLKTLDVYVQADLEMKRAAIEGTPSPVRPGPRRPRRKPDLLTWLESL